MPPRRAKTAAPLPWYAEPFDKPDYLARLTAAGVSAATAKNYSSKMATLLSGMKMTSLRDIYLNVERAIQYAQNRYQDKDTSLSAYLNAVSAPLRHLEDLRTIAGDAAVERLRALNGHQARKVGEARLEQKKSAREAEVWVDWDDVMEAAAKAHAEAEGSRDDVLMSLYSMMPPLRNDFHAVRIRMVGTLPEDAEISTEEGLGNELYVVRVAARGRRRASVKMRLVLREFKTASKYEVIPIDFPAELATRVDAWLKMRKEPVYLFEARAGEPYRDDSFGILLRQVFERWTGKRVGVQMLRKSFITNLLKDCLPLKQAGNIAKIMGHSIPMQATYRRID